MSWSLWLPSSFIFGAFPRGFKGIEKAVLFNVHVYLFVFSVKVNQAIQLQAPQPCPSFGSSFIERAFHATDTSASSSSSVSKNNISTKSTFSGSSNSKLPYPLPQFPSSPTFVGPSVENPARTVYTPTRNYSQVIDQSKAHK